MQFSEIGKELSGIAFETLRKDEKDYFEAVIVSNELAKLTSLLERLLGAPKAPSKEISELLEDFGGIQSGQTLYLKSGTDNNIFAMLWPWQDGHHFTIKIGKIRKVA